MKKRFSIFLAISIVFIFSCQKEKSHETSGTPSVGTLQSDTNGDCLPKNVVGTYEAGVALVGTTNFIEVEVDVTTPGAFTIYTDTVNGYYFRATGVFTSTGANSVILRGNGTPGLSGVNNFIVHYNLQVCNVVVTVLPAGSGGPAVGTLAGGPGACAPFNLNGTYTAGIALTSANSVDIQLNITTAGTYSITTDTIDGVWFVGTGTVLTGSQSKTLTGNGTFVSGGTKTFTVKFGTSTCTFIVNVGAAGAGTLGGSPNACAPFTPSGSYTVGTSLTGSNTVQVQVNITTAGTVNITTNTVTGFSFSFSGSLSTGTQNVTLTGTGTPTTAGTQTFTATFGTSTCTFTINVTGGGGPAAGTLGGAPNACTPFTPSGTYTVGTALTGSNTVQVQVNVTTAGTASITTNTVAGFSFSFSGNLSVGMQNVTLNGIGNPTASGTQTFTATFGTSTCTFTINVNPAGGGAATFTFDCASASIDPDALFEATLQLNCSNKIEFNVNVTALGTYNITTTATNGMTFSASGTFTSLGPQTVILSGTGTPTAGGTFNIPVNVTPACSFSLTVEPPTSDVGWSFTVTNAPATTYKGQEDDAQMIPNAPAVIFGLIGSNSYGTDLFQMALSDANGTINVGETYSTSALTGNQAAFQYDLATSPYCTDIFKADPTVTGVTMTFTVTAHNTGAMVISGTFTGTAKNTAGQTITIASGTFTTQFNPYHF